METLDEVRADDFRAGLFFESEEARLLWDALWIKNQTFKGVHLRRFYRARRVLGFSAIDAFDVPEEMCPSIFGGNWLSLRVNDGDRVPLPRKALLCLQDRLRLIGYDQVPHDVSEEVGELLALVPR